MAGEEALIGALGNIVGTGMTAALSANEAKKQRSWAQFMSSTAYQRGMADMKLAGLNPILAYKQGGASSPTGSMAPMPNFGAGISQGMSAGAAVNQATSAGNLREQQGKVAGSQVGLNTANEVLAGKQGALSDANKINVEANTAKTAAEESRLQTQNALLEAQMPEALLKEAYAKSFIGSKLIQWGPAISSARDLAVGAAGLRFGLGKGAGAIAPAARGGAERTITKGSRLLDRARGTKLPASMTKAGRAQAERLRIIRKKTR